MFVTGSPAEVRGAGRTWDGDGLVYTIDDASRSVCVSVMDFAPVGLYGRHDAGPPVAGGQDIPDNTPVWWPDLFDALLSPPCSRARSTCACWSASGRTRRS